MRQGLFFLQLFIVSALVALILLIMEFVPALAAHHRLSWVSWFMFVVFSAGTYIFASITARSPNPNSFVRFYIISIILKMALSVGVILTYKLQFNPEDKIFILPFFIIYLIFTAFEMYFLTKVEKGGRGS